MARRKIDLEREIIELQKIVLSLDVDSIRIQRTAIQLMMSNPNISQEVEFALMVAAHHVLAPDNPLHVVRNQMDIAQ